MNKSFWTACPCPVCLNCCCSKVPELVGSNCVNSETGTCKCSSEFILNLAANAMVYRRIIGKLEEDAQKRVSITKFESNPNDTWEQRYKALEAHHTLETAELLRRLQQSKRSVEYYEEQLQLSIEDDKALKEILGKEFYRNASRTEVIKTIKNERDEALKMLATARENSWISLCSAHQEYNKKCPQCQSGYWRTS